jgi:hypothetical protein
MHISTMPATRLFNFIAVTLVNQGRMIADVAHEVTCREVKKAGHLPGLSKAAAPVVGAPRITSAVSSGPGPLA